LPSVSVVIPCHNAAATVGRAVTSVAAQSAKPLELIVIDDASTDASGEVLKALQAQYSPGWLNVLTLQTNSGVASARNAGWNAAKGDWVAFLDADDTWYPEKLETQAHALRIHSDADLVGHHHDFTGAGVPKRQGALAISLVGPSMLLWSNKFITSSAMLRRTVPRRFKEGQRHMEDHLLWTQLAFDGRKIVFIDLPLATQYKASFGAGGLSAHLMAMECAEQGNYRSLRRAGHIGLIQWLLLYGWSALKFLRRLFVVRLRRLNGP
jgi:glycosyltransferase involved in cell wall biosynthesis